MYAFFYKHETNKPLGTRHKVRETTYPLGGDRKGKRKRLQNKLGNGVNKDEKNLSSVKIKDEKFKYTENNSIKDEVFIYNKYSFHNMGSISQMHVNPIQEQSNYPNVQES